MATKKTEVKATGDMASKVTALEGRVGVLEKLVQQLVSQRPKPRKQRVYTDDQRATIRARLLAGQEAARKKHETEVKVTKKARSGNSDKVKAVEAEKPAKA